MEFEEDSKNRERERERESDGHGTRPAQLGEEEESA